MFKFLTPVDGSIRLRRLCGHARPRYWALARKFLLGLSLALVCQSALAQAMYRMTPLRSPFDSNVCLYASGLNNAEEVAGTGCDSSQGNHGFVWKNDGAPVFVFKGEESTAAGINASGLVAGEGLDSKGSFVFVSAGGGTPLKKIYLSGRNYPSTSGLNDGGQVTGTISTDLGTYAFMWNSKGSKLLDLGTVKGGIGSEGFAINASGQVAGNAGLPEGNSRTTHAFIWKNDGTPMLDLGSVLGAASTACCINASGQVAGDSYSPSPSSVVHAFLWRNDGTPMHDLGSLGGGTSFTAALNDSGQVVGTAQTKNGEYHAFLWLNNGTPMKDLGTFGGTSSAATDVNFSGQVTGVADFPGNTIRHAFLWRNDGTKMQDLNKLIDPTDPLKPFVTLVYGEYINDFGDIVADGTDSRTGLDDLYLLKGTVLTLSPRSLSFGSQAINASSAAKSVTMTNTSPKVVVISSIALTGSTATQFASTNNCGSSMVGHATCMIKVTFKPTTKGAKTATLNVNGGGGGLRTVKLTGTGT